MKKTPALRYENLYKQIKKFKPKSIMEIGVWMGDTAVKMINTAKALHPAGTLIKYYGFDLFEDITDDEIITEHSKSTKAEYSKVYEKLNRTGADIYLYRGYTRLTLPEAALTFNAEEFVDFIFIDGGHSIETIASDWGYVQSFVGPDTIVIFDDYFYDRNDLGCKNLIDNLDQKEWKYSLLNPIDHFPKSDERGEWTQHTQMVKVTRRKEKD
jgi:hypothetical protein